MAQTIHDSRAHPASRIPVATITHVNGYPLAVSTVVRQLRRRWQLVLHALHEHNVKVPVIGPLLGEERGPFTQLTVLSAHALRLVLESHRDWFEGVVLVFDATVEANALHHRLVHHVFQSRYTHDPPVVVFYGAPASVVARSLHESRVAVGWVRTCPAEALQTGIPPTNWVPVAEDP